MYVQFVDHRKSLWLGTGQQLMTWTSSALEAQLVFFFHDYFDWKINVWKT